ncbi:hypothetical protein EMCRGX_G032905 [Ephydatia muelleri]
MSELEEHLYKVLVIGDFGVGKTSIIRRFAEDVFSPNYKLTIGVDFSLKTIEWDPKTRVNLQLWDIAGHERFGHMTRVYYKYAIAAIIVFDITRKVTFESVLRWLEDVAQKVMLDNEEPVPVILLANKCDHDNKEVEHHMIDSFCQKHKICKWFPTSAKENINIDESMTFLVSTILQLSPKSGSSKDVVDHPNASSDNNSQADSSVVVPNQSDSPKNALCCS